VSKIPLTVLPPISNRYDRRCNDSPCTPGVRKHRGKFLVWHSRRRNKLERPVTEVGREPSVLQYTAADEHVHSGSAIASAR